MRRLIDNNLFMLLNILQVFNTFKNLFGIDSHCWAKKILLPLLVRSIPKNIRRT